MISDLNDIWLQIIIDNGEDCKKTLTAKYEVLSERAECLSKALQVRKTQGAHFTRIAAFWNIVENDEQTCENKRLLAEKAMRSSIDMQKAKSDTILLLQGCSNMSNASTKASSIDQDQDQDEDHCIFVNVLGLKTSVQGKGLRFSG